MKDAWLEQKAENSSALPAETFKSSPLHASSLQPLPVGRNLLPAAPPVFSPQTCLYGGSGGVDEGAGAPRACPPRPPTSHWNFISCRSDNRSHQHVKALGDTHELAHKDVENSHSHSSASPPEPFIPPPTPTPRYFWAFP